MSTISTFIRSSLINHSRFRFQTKKVQKPYPLGRHIPIWLLKGFPPTPRVLSNILFSASFMCLLRSPQLGTLLKDHYDQQQTLWIIRLSYNFTFEIVMPLSKYVRKVVYLPYNQFWRSKILPIVHVSIFLNTTGPQNARNVLRKPNSPKNSTPLRNKCSRFGPSSRWNALSQKKKPGYGPGWG